MLILKNCRFVPFLTEGTDLTQGDVLLDGRTIARIAPPDTDFGADAPVLDLKGKTLLPGLIDMHVHLCMYDDADIVGGAGTLISPCDWTINAVNYAQALLDAGFTTVRDMGDVDCLPAKYVRDAINKGRLTGSRIFTSGPIIESSWTDSTTMGCLADGPMEFRKAARMTMARGADFLKLYGSGSLLMPSNEPGYPIIEPEEIREAVTQARQNSTYVAIHAHGATAIDMAAHEGVHTIEHASMIREDTLAYIEDHYEEIGLVPTLYAFNGILEAPDTPNGVRAHKLLKQIVSSLKSACNQHHVQIGWGTDVGLKIFEQDPMKEFRLRKEMLDCSNEDILRQATIGSARLMYLDDQLGSIREGKLADLIVVDGDPLADISVLYRKPDHVLKEGVLIR
ncbi:MAG: amidohydrolase family protein [Clostridiales bacterium]|nr:amidohydrolase family protein [Clostridiales bacterium]